MKKIFAMLLGLMVFAMASLSLPSAAHANGGSDAATPYTVDASGVTLPAGETFKAHGHVNIRYMTPGDDSTRSAGIHFDPNNNQPGGAWIGKTSIPWSAFNLPAKFCVTWVQVHGFNQHFGEGGQQPVCVGSTTPNNPGDPADNKKVELCHATGSATNSYTKTEVSVNAFFNNGHVNHSDDIWDTFTYVNNAGNEVTVPKQGDTSLLAFDNCVKSPVDVEIAIPAVTSEDKCGINNDTVTPVRDDTKYTTNVGPRVGDTVTVTFTAKDGFVFPGGQKVVTVTKTFTNNVDCDLPATGGEATYNTVLGGLALAGVLILAGVMLVTRKRTS